MLIISFSSLFLRNYVAFSFPLLFLPIFCKLCFSRSVLCAKDDLVFSLAENDLSCEILEKINHLEN
jgi:hypothetical protein